MTLPDDVKYYYVRHGISSDNGRYIELDPESRISAAKKSRLWGPEWYHRQGIQVITDSRFTDWDKWALLGYQREWYKFFEKEEFERKQDSYYVSDFSEEYIDERLLGFYYVWKRQVSRPARDIC